MLEKLADLEHKQWAHWTQYMLDNLTPENIARWRAQIEISYPELSEKEKESDRDWARNVLSVTREAHLNQAKTLKHRLWDLWKDESTPNIVYSGTDAHIEKRLLMGHVAALIDEVFGLQLTEVAGLPLGGFDP